jgi:hypothetical protein
VKSTDQSTGSSASAFAMMTPFKGAVARALEGAVLFAASVLRGHEPAIRARRFLHHAYWVRLPARAFRGGARGSRSSRRGALLFVGSFAGKVSDAAGFMRSHPLELDRVWQHSEHYPGACHYDDLLAFARRYERHAEVSFDACDAGVDEIRSALRLRESLDRLSLDHGADDDEAFCRALHAVAASLWEAA